MRIFYAHILQFSFLIGILQPALPLIEYHIFKESIIERFCVNREVPESDCDGVCYLTAQIAENRQDTDPVALNTDYYPIAVEYVRGFRLIRDLYEVSLFPGYSVSELIVSIRPNAPPPRPA